MRYVNSTADRTDAISTPRFGAQGRVERPFDHERLPCSDAPSRSVQLVIVERHRPGPGALQLDELGSLAG
jgi:hypothetical protein